MTLANNTANAALANLYDETMRHPFGGNLATNYTFIHTPHAPIAYDPVNNVGIARGINTGALVAFEVVGETSTRARDYQDERILRVFSIDTVADDAYIRAACGSFIARTTVNADALQV